MSNLTLHTLSTEYLQAMEYLTDPELNLPAEVIADTLEALAGTVEYKAINVVKFIQNLDVTVDALKEVIEEFELKKFRIEKKIADFKEYLKFEMERTGITKIDCPYFKISVQKNADSTNILDAELIPSIYKTDVVTTKIDKVSIKKYIQAGGIVPGAELKNSTRVVIK